MSKITLKLTLFLTSTIIRALCIFISLPHENCVDPSFLVKLSKSSILFAEESNLYDTYPASFSSMNTPHSER